MSHRNQDAELDHSALARSNKTAPFNNVGMNGCSVLESVVLHPLKRVVYDVVLLGAKIWPSRVLLIK